MSDYDDNEDDYDDGEDDVCEGLGITVMTPKEYFLRSHW